VNLNWVKKIIDFNNDDGFSLQTLLILSFLFILIMLMIGPCYQPYRPKPVDQTTPVPGATGHGAQAKPLHLAPAKPKELFLQEKPSVPVLPTPTTTVTPAPTPPGGGFRQIAFASTRGDGRHYQIYMMDANGNNVTRLTNTQAFDRDPHFAYDGKHLAFSSNRDSGIYQIFLLHLDSGETKQLTFGPDDKTNPIWKPDDKGIVFTLHQDNRQQLGMISADGSNLIKLTSTYGGEDTAYSFAPDGNRVAYESALNNRHEVFVIDLTTKKCEVLIQSGDLTSHGDPVFCPTGRYLIFSSDFYSPRIRQLYVYDLYNSRYQRLTKDEIDRDDPVYSPDGTLIAYIAQWEGVWNIFVMDADGSNVRNLTKSYYDNMVPTWR
jgi:TolB protein